MIETMFRASSCTAWGLVSLIGAVDGVRAADHYQYASVLYRHTVWGGLVIAVGLVCLVVSFADVATYRPRIFALCAESSIALFGELAIFSSSLRKELRLIRSSPASHWSDVKELEEHLLDETNQFVVLDRLRVRITRRILFRLAALVAALAVIGYGMSTVTYGGLLASNVKGLSLTGAGLPEHVYFTLVTFFTIGFGDLYPAHNVAGYTFLTLAIGTFTAIAYFVLTELAASQSEFRSNMRHAAGSYVLQKSAL
jgi:uncharacterized membrane protein YiaA